MLKTKDESCTAQVNFLQAQEKVRDSRRNCEQTRQFQFQEII